MTSKNGAHRWLGVVAGVVVLGLAWATPLKKPVKWFLSALGIVMLLSHWDVITKQLQSLGKNL